MTEEVCQVDQKQVIHEIWGRSNRSKRVHYFVNGESLCGRVRNPEYIVNQWDESDPDTCRACLGLKKWHDRGLIKLEIS